MRTLVILTGDFPPTNIVGALRPFRLAKKMLREGWRVVVLTRPPRAGQALDTELLTELNDHCTIHFIKPEPSFKQTSSVFMRRLKGSVREQIQKIAIPDIDVIDVPAYVKLLKKIQAEHQVDVVVTTSPSHSIHLAGLKIKKRYNFPWLVDFRDPWDDFVSTGKATIRNPLERYLEQQVIFKADVIVSTTKKYTELLKDRHQKLSAAKFHTITNSFDETKINKNALKSPDKFVICYTGIFYPSKNPYIFFESLKKWFDQMTPEEDQQYRQRLEIRLIGSGDATTRKFVADLQLQGNVVIYDRMPHEQAIAMTCAADMTLISTGQGEKTRPGWLPSKLFEYLGCRVPILALIREGEMEQIIRETQSGYVVTEDVDQQVKKIIEECVNKKFYPAIVGFLPVCAFNETDRFEEKQTMLHFFKLVDLLSTGNQQVLL